MRTCRTRSRDTSDRDVVDGNLDKKSRSLSAGVRLVSVLSATGNEDQSTDEISKTSASGTLKNRKRGYRSWNRSKRLIVDEDDGGDDDESLGSSTAGGDKSVSTCTTTGSNAGDGRFLNWL